MYIYNRGRKTKMSSEEQKYVDANPTKDFFIYMITRDIESKAAIVELIDNAIDGAKRVRKDGDYKGLSISLDFNKDYILFQGHMYQMMSYGILPQWQSN